MGYTEEDYEILQGKSLEKTIHVQTEDILNAYSLIPIHINNFKKTVCPECLKPIGVILEDSKDLPDFLVIGKKGLFVIELKRVGGRLRKGQKIWLADLARRFPEVPQLISNDIQEVEDFIKKHK